MLLQNADDIFQSPDWTYEPKWDGFRILASVRNGGPAATPQPCHQHPAWELPASGEEAGQPQYPGPGRETSQTGKSM